MVEARRPQEDAGGSYALEMAAILDRPRSGRTLAGRSPIVASPENNRRQRRRRRRRPRTSDSAEPAHQSVFSSANASHVT
jgi:hypothetical protein